MLAGTMSALTTLLHLPMMHRALPRIFSAFAAAVTLAACSADTAPPRKALPSMRDSIRIKRERRIATRPDTFGMRVDSMRILRPGPRATGVVPWVVVISDFQCDACRRFALDVLPEIRRDIIERGGAQLAVVNYPQEVHFNARFAALAALCAASAGRFWDVHDSLFTSLPRWDRLPDPQGFMDSLAIRAGVPADVQQSCTQRGRLLRVLEGDIRRSEQAGANDLPVVFVGEQRLGTPQRTVEGIRRAIADATSQRR